MSFTTFVQKVKAQVTRSAIPSFQLIITPPTESPERVPSLPRRSSTFSLSSKGLSEEQRFARHCFGIDRFDDKPNEIDSKLSGASRVRDQDNTPKKVRTLTGKEIELDVEADNKIERVKEKVEEKEGIPPVQQRLIYGGKQMADDKLVRDYDLEPGATLHLVLALRGGSL
ncbi:hypothetical protein DSL72_005532 [Monilinia vaccinii-corymbosi]|uniref:Ubiquitin-like domain-containing protein n=1 Tax=Monilinia vaccinii-corymbosi TaxID=61207 RepID=A0A8A3PFE3_9HELO|nr:hypothetical protein DSL72_005532 [Monilinia vaccinii-corymbosi]